jgi:hypothetical protein
MNEFGKMKWEVSKRTKTVNFLDLTIYIDQHNNIQTELYEKPENLYLYLPSNSCHPIGNFKGLVYGSVFRILKLTTSPNKRREAIDNLYKRLLSRGYQKSMLITMINKAHYNISPQLGQTQPPNDDTRPSDTDIEEGKTIFFHMTYHPEDLLSTIIQQYFNKHIMYQQGLLDLPKLKNHNNVEINITRLLIAYHRTPNIGNYLSPCILKAEHGPLVSSYMTRDQGAITHTV